MFVAKGLMGNKSTLVQVMAWRQTGDKPLPEAMLTQLTDQVMAWRQTGDKPLPEAMLTQFTDAYMRH